MRVIKGEGQRKFMKQQILAAATGGILDTSQGEFEKLVRSNTVDGRFLRRLLNPPRRAKLSRRIK